MTSAGPWEMDSFPSVGIPMLGMAVTLSIIAGPPVTTLGGGTVEMWKKPQGVSKHQTKLPTVQIVLWGFRPPFSLVKDLTWWLLSRDLKSVCFTFFLCGLRCHLESRVDGVSNGHFFRRVWLLGGQQRRSLRHLRVWCWALGSIVTA